MYFLRASLDGFCRITLRRVSLGLSLHLVDLAAVVPIEPSRNIVMSISTSNGSSTLLRSFSQVLRCWTASKPGKCLHTTTSRAATALPNTTAGPPPSAPVPAASQHGERADRKRRQAEMLKRGQELRAGQTKHGSVLRKRLWKEVNVHTDGGMDRYQYKTRNHFSLYTRSDFLASS